MSSSEGAETFSGAVSGVTCVTCKFRGISEATRQAAAHADTTPFGLGEAIEDARYAARATQQAAVDMGDPTDQDTAELAGLDKLSLVIDVVEAGETVIPAHPTGGFLTGAEHVIIESDPSHQEQKTLTGTSAAAVGCFAVAAGYGCEQPITTHPRADS